MPITVRDLIPLTPTSSGSTVSIGIGHLDDASSITIFFTSSAAGSSTAALVQISQFDPSDLFPTVGTNQSSAFYTVSSSAPITSSGPFAISLTNISFRGFRLSAITSFTSGEVIAFVSKQITV